MMSVGRCFRGNDVLGTFVGSVNVGRRLERDPVREMAATTTLSSNWREVESKGERTARFNLPMSSPSRISLASSL